MFEYPQALMTIWRRVGFSLTIALLVPVCLKAQNTRNVLVLHEGSANQPAHLLISGAFREVFGSDIRTQLFEEYFDQDRLSRDDETLAASLRQKYVGKKMDLVVSVGGPAFKFILRRGEELWPATPKIFSFVELREIPAKLPSNMTGVASTVDFGATLDLALQLIPNTQRVFYVIGVTPHEELFRSLAEQDFQRFGGRIEFTYLYELPLSELLDRLGRLPDNSVVIYAGIQQDASRQVYVPAQVCSLITSASNAPVYGPYEPYFGRGIVGGVVLDFQDVAKQTARLGLKVLERGTAAGFPVEQSSPSRAMVDWRQLQRWGISEKRLPSGTIVRFRTPSLWEQYKWYVLATLAAIIAQLALIIILIVEMRRRKTADLAVKNLSGRLINASEEERKRLARELHDDIGQRLSLVSIDLDALDHDFATNKSTGHEALNGSLQQLNEIISDVHNLSHQLHSSKLQHLGLETVLNDICRQLSRQHGLQIQFTSDGVPCPLQEDLALCFYRVAQEALNNSVKHSGASRVDVRLAACEGTLSMTIKDYGAGFDSSNDGNGLGLATMRERLRLVGGELVLNSTYGGGTEVTARAQLGRVLRQTTAA